MNNLFENDYLFYNLIKILLKYENNNPLFSYSLYDLFKLRKINKCCKDCIDDLILINNKFLSLENINITNDTQFEFYFNEHTKKMLNIEFNYKKLLFPLHKTNLLLPNNILLKINNICNIDTNICFNNNIYKWPSSLDIQIKFCIFVINLTSYNLQLYYLYNNNYTNTLNINTLEQILINCSDNRTFKILINEQELIFSFNSENYPHTIKYCNNLNKHIFSIKIFIYNENNIIKYKLTDNYYNISES